jgi:hypothetical protein
VNNRLINLKNRIETELLDIIQTANRAFNAWQLSKQFADQKDYYLDSVALNLHGFYNGLERIFELIARQLDPTFPLGERWHKDLLNQMSSDIPQVRPKVISPVTAALLGELLAFRHLLRNIYAFKLDEKPLERLVSILIDILPYIKQDLEIFCDLLSIAAGKDQH